MSGRGLIEGLQAPGSRERPADMLMRAIVDSIVAGRYDAEQALPPEAALAEHFGVSRTIVRESMKRLEEKGLVTVQQGRGTLVQPHSVWNVLDPLVLSAVIAHDERLHTLDELTLVRGALEGVMAAQAAERSTEEGLAQLAAALERMIEAAGDYAQFRDADAAFHHTVMGLSENFLASNIAGTLYGRARSFARFEGEPPPDAIDRTIEQHRAIYEAIAAGDVPAAHHAMNEHIVDAWRRRSPARTS
jgi:GntR family galactonate operon transcriptional repressor